MGIPKTHVTYYNSIQKGYKLKTLNGKLFLAMATIKSGTVDIFPDSINIHNTNKYPASSNIQSQGWKSCMVSDGIFRQYLNLCMEHVVM